jgi:hypothetical protein
MINLGQRQECPILPAPFNIYIDEIVLNWQKETTTTSMGNILVTTSLFADNLFILYLLHPTMIYKDRFINPI